MTTPPTPTSYATTDEFAAATAHLDLDLPDDIGALLDRASEDLDGYLRFPIPEDPDGDGDLPVRRIPEAALTRWERRILSRACVLQAAYRVTVGEEDIVEGKNRVLSAVGGELRRGRAGPDRPGRARRARRCPEIDRARDRHR